MTVSTKAMYVNKFLRAYPNSFTIREFIKYMSYVGCKIAKDEAIEIVETSPYLFRISDDKFITRAGVFTDQYFSVLLTKEECDNKCFLPGHRCMPFVDQEMMTQAFVFLCEAGALANKVVEFYKEFALEHFVLYGEEYEAQYIANDPAMQKFNLADNNFELPRKVNLTTVDLEPLFNLYDIKPGDRLLFKVENWDEGVLYVEPCLREHGQTLALSAEDIERSRWNKTIEKLLLDQFDRLGPCTSIEEQLADLFFENIDELCVKNCSSVEEFLKKTKAVSLELFGVETRLWHTGQFVPAVGKWNSEERSDDEDEVAGFQNLIYTIPDFVLDEYIKDFIYKKKDNVEDLIAEIFPKNSFLPAEYRQELIVSIQKRIEVILKSYNWFADRALGDIRNRALSLYTRISALVYDIDRTGGKFKNYPQQELVILIQLYTHLTKLIESIAFDGSSIAEDSDTIFISLDGMEFNFDDIAPDLRKAVIACRKNEFIVLK